MSIAQITDGELDKLVHQFEVDGFVIRPKLLDPKTLDHIATVARARLAAVRDKLGSQDIGIGSVAGYDEIVQRSPGRWDVPITLEEFDVKDEDMPWWPLITATLGEGAEHMFSGVVSSESNTPAQEWHTDSPHESVEYRPVHAINVLVALQDIPMKMGPTEFAVGSQTLTNHLKNTSLVVEELLYQHDTTNPALLVKNTDDALPECRTAALPAGTCIAFDDRILHRGLDNQSDVTRHVAYFSYCAKGYTPTTHFEAQKSVYQ